MKLFNLTIKNGIALGVVIVLALAMLWLINGQSSTSLTAQSGEATLTATTTPFPSATLTSPVRPTPAPSPTPETTALPSPIPSPTFGLLVATPLPNADVWPTSDATPITTDPYPIFDARILQGPTYTPTPEATPEIMSVVEPDQPVAGYVFSEARLVPGTLGSYIQLVEWLPDEPDQLLIIRDSKFLEAIDIRTGETRLYNDGQTRVLNPVWLPERQAVAYLTIDDQDYTTQYLWISEEGVDQPKLLATPVFTTSWLPPLAAAPDGHGIILFDANWQLTQIDSLNTQPAKLASNTQAYVPTSYDHGALYQIAQSPDRSQAIYFNKERVLLADFTTGSLTPIDLEALRTEDMPPTHHIQAAAWSPKSDQIALLVAAGGVYDGNNLFILNLQSNSLNFVQDQFHYIDNLAWAPDNIHLVLLAVTGGMEGYSTGSLFLTDITPEKMVSLAAFPKNAVIGSPRDLTWSSNGKFIAVIFGDEPRHPGTYIIDIK